MWVVVESDEELTARVYPTQEAAQERLEDIYRELKNGEGYDPENLPQVTHYGDRLEWVLEHGEGGWVQILPASAP